MHFSLRRAAGAGAIWLLTGAALPSVAWAAEPAPGEGKVVVLATAVLTKLETDAAGGSVDAQLELALAYDDGTAGKRDQAKAALWYRRAADQNVGVAHLRLGMLHEAGAGVTQSYPEARVHYERAVTLGVAEANLRLGIIYLEGWGVARNPAMAVAFVEKAAEAGYQPAQRVLSDMYVGGIGVKRDPAKALTWAERAARDRNPDSELQMGKLAWASRGIKQDVQLAREWFQLSASQEYSSGMLAMAGTFLRAGRTPEEAALGVRWLELAVDSGNTAAAFYLAAHRTMTAGAALDAATELRVRELLEQATRGGESTADEVLELAKDGMTWREAFGYVLNTAYENRYVQRNQRAHLGGDQSGVAQRQPVVTKIVRPIYPQALRLTRQTGEVVVDFLVDSTGRVRNPFVVRSTHPAFSDRALVAVRQWIFLPGVRNGSAVTTHMQVPIQFVFSEVEEGGRKPKAVTPVVDPAVK
jgi:TonB family protein